MTALKPRIAGVIGWPVAHSKSPLIHRFWLKKLGLDGDYSRFPVHPDNLEAALRALAVLGLSGVNVTVPHKEAAFATVDELTSAARTIGAVNTVVADRHGRLTGYNTDVDGVADALSGQSIRGAGACIVGAGGAARAALHALREGGIADVAFLARTPARGESLLAEFGLKGAVYALEDARTALSGRTIAINASPMGMIGQPPMVPEVLSGLPALAEDALVFDMVYAPIDTALLSASRNAGHRTADGLVMLIGQAARAFELFYGAPAPRANDDELRGLLLE